MGLIKIESGSVSPVKKFKTLLIGETFRYASDLYLKVDSSRAFKFDQMYCVGFNDAECVLPVNSTLVVDN